MVGDLRSAHACNATAGWCGVVMRLRTLQTLLAHETNVIQGTYEDSYLHCFAFQFNASAIISSGCRKEWVRRELAPTLVHLLPNGTPYGFLNKALHYFSSLSMQSRCFCLQTMLFQVIWDRIRIKEVSQTLCVWIIGYCKNSKMIIMPV